MSNLGMQLELSMTAKGVQATLKDAQGAIVQTAQVVKSQLGPGGAADQGLSKFKEGIGRARETAMFFTSALGEFGPAGRTAQMALSGVAGAIIGGGGVLFALEGARLAIGLLTDAWTAESKAAKEAADKSLAAAKSIADAAAASAAARVADVQSQLYTPQLRLQLKFQEDLKKVNAQIAESRRQTGDDVRSEETKQLVAERDRLIASYRIELEQLRMLDDITKSKRAAESAERKAAQVKPAKKPIRESVGFDGYEDEGRGLADLRKLEAADFARAQAASEAAAKKMAADAKKVSEEWAATGQAMGQAIGTAFANIITGAASVKEAMAGMLKGIVGMVIDSVKAQIMANAAAAAAEAAKSQAGIPVIGPILAGGAMVAMLSLVQGLVNQIPSAAGGWERVPNDTMAMIHKDEQVLPAQYAEGLRQLVAGGGGGGITVNISATDAKGVERLFLQNTGALARAIGRAARDGRRFG